MPKNTKNSLWFNHRDIEAEVSNSLGEKTIDSNPVEIKGVVSNHQRVEAIVFNPLGGESSSLRLSRKATTSNAVEAIVSSPMGMEAIVSNPIEWRKQFLIQ